MRCDLHVHTTHSGMCSIPLLNRICRESYNDPHEVYDTLKARGMRLAAERDIIQLGCLTTWIGSSTAEPHAQDR